MVASVVHDHLQALKSLSSQEAQEQRGVFQIEVSLWMFYKVPFVVLPLNNLLNSLSFEMGEGLSEELLLQTKQFFVTNLENLAAPNSLSYHPHPAISNIYFNVVLRYAKLLHGNPHVLQQVLASLFDQRSASLFALWWFRLRVHFPLLLVPRGIRSSRKYTRAKCADLLVRVVRLNQLRNDLVPITPMIVEALKCVSVFTLSVLSGLNSSNRDLLRFNASASSRQSSPVKGAGTFNVPKPTNGSQAGNELEFEDQLNLFEALGVLIGQFSTEHMRNDQARFMEVRFSSIT